MTAADTHRRAAVKRRIIEARKSNAYDAIGTLEPGCELFILTHGQFSLVHALKAILDQTGPANVALSTWTAADADLSTAADMMGRSGIRTMRFIVDRSFLTRQPSYCNKMRRLFGDQCIRTTRTHAKFATITNDEWNIAIRTSMNLNSNPRLENLEISDDEGLCSFLVGQVDDIYSDQDAGTFDGELPPVDPAINIGTVSEVGRPARVGTRRH